MKKAMRGAALAAALFGAGAGAASGQGVPVIDTTSIAKAIQQIEQMRRDYAAQMDQLDNMQRRLESITGDKGISDILNSAGLQDARDGADSLSGIMIGAMTGAPIGGDSDRITGRIEELTATFELGDLSDFLGSDRPQDRALATRAGAGMAAMATAEDSYATADRAVGRVNQLIGGIDDNADLKASLDYNTRVLGEIAVLLNEMLRVQSAMANAMGSSAVVGARDRAAQREFMQASDGGEE